MKTFAIALPLLSLLGLPAGGQSASTADPHLWPDAQRAFLQEGPGLLLDGEQRAAFLALDEAGRSAFIRDFLDRDPIPETPENELREGIRRRWSLVAREFWSPLDARAQLLFLQGPPRVRDVIDCGSAFKPLEVWTYGQPPVDRLLVLYQPAPSEPFRLWLPIDSKQALYTSDMANWLEQWVAFGMGGKRIDRRFCPSSEEVDRATGIDGLRGKRVATVTKTTRNDFAHQPERTETIRDFRWTRPQDRAALLGRPKSLADWARDAAATPVPPEPPRLAIESFAMDFPSWQGQRLTSRVLLSLAPGEEKEFAKVADGDKPPVVRLTVEGALESDERIFDTFRVRYRLPVPTTQTAPAAESGLPLLFDRPLRPGQTFLLRLRVRDEGSNAQVLLSQGFRVPDAPVVKLASAAAVAVPGEAQTLRLATHDTLYLLPPFGEVMLGVWRAETLVAGDRITKVLFLVDGEAQLTRTHPPYAAEVRLSPFPREQVVRAEGYDDAGALVAADEIVLNQARGTFRVAIAEPKASAHPAAHTNDKAKVRAEIVVPEERRIERVELRLNDVPVEIKTAPPWQWEVKVPKDDIVYVGVSAELDDGSKNEAVRFLRAPENMEQVDVDLVELYTTVTDSSGQNVRGLTAADFEVLEDGKPQKLAKFEQVENLPLTLGFLIDTSISMATSLGEAQRAAASILHSLMTPKDHAFGIGFSFQPYLVMPPTDDVEGLIQALDGLRAHGRTSIHDAVVTGLYYFRSTKGQRAMILLTDGDDNASSTPWPTALDYARRSGVAIFTVGLDIPLHDREARNKMSELAAATGGRVFYISHAEELTGVFTQIEQELRSRYLLAYNSDRKADDLGFRPVEVKVKRGLKARTARGYYP
jgi:Ca-activated chloride channel family protein